MLEKALLLFVVSVVSMPQLLAQGFEVQTRPVRGFMPNTDQLSSPVDHIDPVSGKVHLEIPIASLPSGRGGSGFDLNLVYDTHIWDLYPEVIDPPPPFDLTEPPVVGHYLWPVWATNGGWNLNIFNVGLDFETKIDANAYWPECFTPNARLYRLRVRLLDGSWHVMHLKGWGQERPDNYDGNGFMPIDPAGRAHCYQTDPNHSLVSFSQQTGWLTYFSDDGSYLKLEIYADGSANWGNKTWYLYLPDGSRITGGPQLTQIYDANGNRIAYLENVCADWPTCSQYYASVKNDAGHEIRIQTQPQNGTPETTTITATGPPPTPNDPPTVITTTLNWEVLRIGADQRRYTRAQTVGGWDTSIGLDQYLLTLKYVQLPLAAAVPPNLSPPVHNSYAFGYALDDDQGYGELDSMRIPSGATFHYRYTYEGATAISSEIIAHGNAIRERRVTQTGLPDLVWTYSGGVDGTEAYVSVTSPDMSTTKYFHGPTGAYLDPTISNNWSFSELVYKIVEEQSGQISRVQKRVWSQNRPFPGGSSGFTSHFVNAWVKTETNTVGSSVGSPPLTAVTERLIDKNGNLLQSTEYDWVNYNPSGIETASAVKRRTQLTYYAGVSAYNSTADDTKAYWNPHFSPLSPTEPRRLDALFRKEVRDSSNAIVAITELDYDGTEFRAGNVKSEKRWDSVKAPSPPALGQLNSSNSQILGRLYDTFGNLVELNGSQIRTRIEYDATGSFPEHVYYAYQTPAQRAWEYHWHFGSGTLEWKKDVDNNITTSYQYDGVGRQTVINEANLRKAETFFEDANRKVTVRKDLVTYDDRKLVVETQYDELGRVALTRTTEPPGNPGDKINVRSTYYPTANRTVQSSPYRTTSDPTLEWTCTQTDALKRVTAVAMFKGSAEPTDCESTTNRTGITRTVYDANWTRITDPASKTRAEERNSLGQLVRVVEDPGGLSYETLYTYDGLGNLVTVAQGVQTRSFQYSSLGRLLSAANPESGTISYTYNESGDLLTRTDPRTLPSSSTHITTTFGYDDLHRISRKTYNDGTPEVTYEYYLAGSLPKVGQLRRVSSDVAWTQNDSYDLLGRVTSSSQMIAGDPLTRTFVYDYWLNNSVKTVINPSGRVIQYDVDDAGRAIKVRSGSTTYADMTVSTAPFTADGRIAQMKLGNNLWETRTYQTAGTPTLFKLGASAGANDRLELEYNFSATANNGNLLSHIVRQPGPGHTWTQTYSYDQLNRLTAATEAGGWSNTYGYDRYGNRWVSSSSGPFAGEPHEPTVSTNFDATNNRIAVDNSIFDSAGNQTYFAPWTLAYDAEKRMKAVSSGDSGNAQYSYDGDGRRVKKTWAPNGGTPVTTYYLYNALGQLAAEYSTQPPSTSTSYVHTDMLGSTRMVTNASGAVLECYDYLPFGRLLSDAFNGRNTGCFPSNPDTQINSKLPQKFTGKERDAETRLDFFEARYMSAAQGRFTTTDPVVMAPHKVGDPQNWNLYAYARNNPLRFTDPNGEDIIEDVDQKYWKRYQKWKREYLSTAAGREQWEQYANDASFLLVIKVGKKKDQGAETFGRWGTNGDMIGATILLGENLSSGFPDAMNYPVTSSLDRTNISGDTVAATKFAHEFGHVNRMRQEDGRQFVWQDVLAALWNATFLMNGQDVNHPAVKAVEQQLGGTPTDVKKIREHWAEANTIPYLRDRFPGKAMPGQIRQAIQDYQKTYPGRVP